MKVEGAQKKGTENPVIETYQQHSLEHNFRCRPPGEYSIHGVATNVHSRCTGVENAAWAGFTATRNVGDFLVRKNADSKMIIFECKNCVFYCDPFYTVRILPRR